MPGAAATQPNADRLDDARRQDVGAPRDEGANWANPRFSPDGQKLAIDISDGKQRDIWVYEWARDTLTQLTFDPVRIAFRSGRPTAGASCSASDRAKAGSRQLVHG